MFKVARLRPDGMITAKADTGGLGQLQNVSRRSECFRKTQNRERCDWSNSASGLQCCHHLRLPSLPKYRVSWRHGTAGCVKAWDV